MKSNSQPKQADYDPQFYQLREVATILGVSKSWVSQQIKHGKIPCLRIGCYPLIGKAFIDDLVKKSNMTFESAAVPAKKVGNA
jgi:hypothetical protein